jgi:hypothetical protein
MYTNIFNNINQAIKINKTDFLKIENIEEIKELYGEDFINEILNNNDPLIEYYYNNHLIC